MAGGFRFRLEVVQKLRQQRLDAQRRVVADAVRAVGSVEDRIGQLTQELSGSVLQSRDVQRARRLDISSLCAHQHRRGWVHRQITEAERELQRTVDELNREREKLAEDVKQLKVIEKLREKQKLRYDTAIRRQEQAGYDEAALQLHWRRRIA